MGARIIDGKKIAGDIRQEVREDVEKFRAAYGKSPGLAFVLIGDHPASQVYVRMKGKACDELGMYSVTERFDSHVSRDRVLGFLNDLNHDSSIHGILVQLPLPPQLNEMEIIRTIDHRKDVDGFHPINVGKLVLGEPALRPCTPAGILELLARSGHDPSGRHVVVVGRSNIVGKPVANMLFQKQEKANAVVTVVHTGAKDLTRYTREADILIAAMGKPRIITGSMIKSGAVVIDVGTNRVDDPQAKKGYRIVGDVDFDSAVNVASAITPVPGGVGPMTIAMLMKNTLQAAVDLASS